MTKYTLLGSVIAAGLATSCAAANSAYEENLPPADMSVASNDDLTGVIGGCVVSSTYSAQQTPAAMMVLLDRSSSMASGNKFPTAAQAIISAIDEDVFDGMSLGLYMSPNVGTVNGPQCIFGLPVACGNPALAQVPLTAAGTMKSADGSGVRSRIYSAMANTSPDSSQGDATPLYGAMDASIKTLQGYNTSKRILLVVSDGTIDCTSLASPSRPAYTDGNGCNDWEKPDNIISLLQTANLDPNKPIETFIVGVPGADTYDPQGVNYPPYHMRLALSAFAYAGSPSNVPANCTGKTFTQAGGDPTVSCHFDMTQQGGFTSAALASVIAQVRGRVAACSYDLPMPAGVVLDKALVNVVLTTDGKSQNLYRRQDPNNPCTGTGCWDYSSDGKVQLIGAACSAAQSAAKIDVKISVGCQTIVG
jgi:hypothetical protein